MADSTHVFTPMTTEAYLKQNDANVIAFDWGVAANDSNYLRSRNRINEAGRVGASFLDFLVINRLMKYEDCTLVGYSLGAHLAGMIGKHTRYGLVEIIIGLDPAGAFFDINNPTTRLTTTDAFYVEIIHTNGGGLGIGNPIGHADFYPNGKKVWILSVHSIKISYFVTGGRNQPGCENDDGCSHGRSFRMFAESINSNNFGAFRCQRFDQIICLGEPRGFMGDPNNAELRLRGFFRLLTNSEAPFARG